MLLQIQCWEYTYFHYTKRGVHMCTTSFNIQKTCILPTPRTNIYVFLQNIWSFWLSSKNSICIMWDINWNFIYDLRHRNNVTSQRLPSATYSKQFPITFHSSLLNTKLASNPPLTERHAGTTQKPLQLYNFYLSPKQMQCLSQSHPHPLLHLPVRDFKIP